MTIPAAAGGRPPLLTCAIITAIAVESASTYHGRMSAILPPDRWDARPDPSAES